MPPTPARTSAATARPTPANVDAPRYAAAHGFLADMKRTYRQRPAIYREVLRCLNQVWRSPQMLETVARIEALLGAEPELLAAFRGFMPPAAAQAWAAAAPPPAAHIGRGEGTSSEPITFEDSDDEAAAPAPAGAFAARIFP